MYGLTDKLAVVTGAGVGIGKSIALRLAQEGANVVVLDIDATTAEQTAREIRDLGRQSQGLQVDVSDFAQVDNAVRTSLRAFGTIDILVNNAGISPMGLLVDTTVETFDKVMRVNLHGVFNGCKAVGPHMMERKTGKIINIASWFGKVGKHSFSAYCASKFGVIGLTQSLAMEMASHGVNVNAVCPGTIVETAMREETDREAVRLGRLTAKQREAQIPLGRVGLPADIAKAVAFLASHESDYMTGQALNVTGGLIMH
jgi:NAD(P)-dependent dehydrogenase (short-subunit alcohol dehydrogenase family)